MQEAVDVVGIVGDRAAALEQSDMPADARFRDAVMVTSNSAPRVAMQNSNAETDDELHPLRHVPMWTW